MDETLEEYAPGALANVVHRSVQLPCDLELADANLVGGAVNGGTASATVTLPTVSTNALGSIGQTAGATGFNLALTSCPTTGSVRAYFENIGVEQTTGNLSNKAVASGGKNPAQNVEVQILSANSTPIDLRTNTGNNVLVNFSATGGATLYYSAQYIATGAVGAGLVSADLIYSLDYH